MNHSLITQLNCCRTRIKRSSCRYKKTINSIVGLHHTTWSGIIFLKHQTAKCTIPYSSFTRHFFVDTPSPRLHSIHLFCLFCSCLNFSDCVILIRNDLPNLFPFVTRHPFYFTEFDSSPVSAFSQTEENCICCMIKSVLIFLKPYKAKFGNIQCVKKTGSNSY